MHKKVLVCLPLNDAHRAALEASVPEFEFRFNALDDVHAEDVLWADVVLGNAPGSPPIVFVLGSPVVFSHEESSSPAIWSGGSSTLILSEKSRCCQAGKLYKFGSEKL